MLKVIFKVFLIELVIEFINYKKLPIISNPNLKLHQIDHKPGPS